MGLVGTYLGTALYGSLFLIFDVWLSAWNSSFASQVTGMVSATLVLIPIAALLIGTACIYLTGPVAVAFCFLLRWIDPVEPKPPGAV